MTVVVITDLSGCPAGHQCRVVILQIEDDAYAGWDHPCPAAAADHRRKVCHLLGLHHPTIIALLSFNVEKGGGNYACRGSRVYRVHKDNL